MANMRRVGEVIAGIIIGIAGGLVAASIINYLSGRPICPVCKKKIPPEIRSCPFCKTALKWE